MREILFKAKDIKTGSWVFGSYVKCKNSKGETFHQIDNGDFNNHRVYEVDPETLCQYTGLKDVEGNKIFEGDRVRAMVKDVIHPQDAYKIKDKYIQSYVYWDFCSGRFETDFNCFSFEESELVLKVTGNIHD